MNTERAEHFCSNLQTHGNIESETIQVSSIEDNYDFNSDQQSDNFYNVKLDSLGLEKGDIRDSVFHPSSPKYYAIKSHIRHFYNPPEEDIFDSGEFMEGDDFQFTTEPQANADWCCYIHLCVGVNLLMIGVISLVVSVLPSDTNTEVGQKELCQLVGLAALICGVIVVVCSWLRNRPHSYLPPPSPAAYYCVSLGCRSQHIPLYGTIGPIQPSFVISQK